MKVRHDEGVANHIGPEPCVAVRKDGGEASVGEGIGQPYSSLSAIARAITGTVWNGPRFFAVKSAPGNDRPVHGRRRARPAAETQPSARASQTSPQ